MTPTPQMPLFYTFQMPQMKHNNNTATPSAGQDEQCRIPQECHNDAYQHQSIPVLPQASKLQHKWLTKATITLATLNINGFMSLSYMSGIDKWSAIYHTQ
jgi:hypothetical protein